VVFDAQNRSDSDLVDDVRSGRNEAFEILMTRYYDRIYGAVGRMIRDPERARDLTQECFIRAWRALGTFGGQAGFYTWLYQISRNVVISEVRKERARPRISASLNDDGPRSSARALEPEDARPAAEERLLLRERREIVLDAVAALSPDFREVVVLRDIEDRSYEEMAELLDIPVGTVRSRLFRARLELKAKVEEALGS
jgi:RNA polymerase sigma-70 factor, ECF subfamily